MIEAVKFAWICFRLYRRHQRSLDRGEFSVFTSKFAGVPNFAMLLGTGRAAWRVSDIATHYFARRGLNFRE